MSEPSICCLCLTADRQRLTDRAVRSFNSQTYENRWMLIFDTGEHAYVPAEDIDGRKVVIVHSPTGRGRRIGALRNEAVDLAARADLIAHWDSDDWSHPDRLLTQMSHAPFTPSGATGFSNMLLFDSRDGKKNSWEYTYQDRRRVLGTSLLYFRSVWQAHPFDEHKIEGEDKNWPDTNGVKGTCGIDSVPLLIADYHGANTGAYGRTVATGTPVLFDQTPAQIAHNPQFRRAPGWDAYAREVMV